MDELMIRNEKTGRFVKTAYPKIDLAACIFCGADTAVTASIPESNWGSCEGLYPRSFWVQCQECGCRGPELDKEHAISEWNNLADQLGIKKKIRVPA